MNKAETPRFDHFAAFHGAQMEAFLDGQAERLATLALMCEQADDPELLAVITETLELAFVAGAMAESSDPA